MAFLLPMLPAIISAVGAIGSTVGGALMNRKTQEQAAQSTAPTGAQAVAPATAGAMSPESFKNASTAHWQQLLGGLGQGVEGGGLPQGIQSEIDRQAGLLG